MNKYLLRGLVLMALSIGVGLLGGYLQQEERSFYRWPMIVAVILFGIGFLTVLYGLIRKIERRSILEQRAQDQENGAKKK